MLLILATALSACESFHRGAPAPEENAAIFVQEGADYQFQPSQPPSDGEVLTAQQAFDAVLGERHQGPMPIPATTTAIYGYLTENDTSPPADRMAVWAFRAKGGCSNTLEATESQCYQWTFARAADGKDLRVMDQEVIS